jgi:putative glutamine amidotransferase
MRPEWKGDAVRDRYEMALLRAAMDLGRPVLGVCRGLQLINVAFGGTLHQDIVMQQPGAQVHRDWERYDKVQHDITFEPDSWLRQTYAGRTGGRVNSVHHQGIAKLGAGLRVEARSVPDGVIEAVRYGTAPFVYAVQWHPEFQDPADRTLLDTAPLRNLFLEAATTARHQQSGAPVPRYPGASI